MKALPIGIQEFRHIIEHDYLYVDKTPQIFELVRTVKYAFISRPRRFGKSLLISTLKELFSGHQSLFKDLWIYNKITWESYPIIHINFAIFGYQSKELTTVINQHLSEIAQQNDIELTDNITHPFKLRELIVKLAAKTGKKVVVLIDEYDKPIIDHLENMPQAIKNRADLKQFYGILKEVDAHLRFVLLTGVSKFSKVSIFSDLNNLYDLTHHIYFSNLMGITEEELTNNFTPHLQSLGKQLNTSQTALLQKIKEWYNGYSWDGKQFFYNPFSLLNLFGNEVFRNYWFSTGTPTFLVKLIQKEQYVLSDFEQKRVHLYFFEKFSLSNIDIYAVLFQTGYLTIKKIEKRFNTEYFILGYPNNEVRLSFLHNLFEGFAYKKPSDTAEMVWKIEDCLVAKDIPQFIKILTSLFASIAHNLLQQPIQDESAHFWEGYYHSVIYIILKIIGINIQVEVATNKGRIDAVIDIDNYIYIMEFKIGNAQKAIEQIKERTYYQAYQHRTKSIILVGIGFDADKRNIGDWKMEEVKK